MGFKGMALNPTVKKALILSGKIGVPLAVTYGTVRLGVWGSANDSLSLASRARAVLPDASALANKLPGRVTETPAGTAVSVPQPAPSRDSSGED